MGRKKKDSNFYPESVGDYESGYGKPPPNKQFKKGAPSPNPHGRRKGSLNKVAPDRLSEIIQEQRSRVLPVKDGGKLTKMPTDRLIINGIFRSAAAGDHRARKLAMEIMIMDDKRARDERNARFDAAVDYKERWAEESKERKRLGIPDPEVLFHPDNLILDFENNDVHYVGMTPDQEKLMQMMYDYIGFCQATLLRLARDVDKEDLAPQHLELMLREFARATHLLRAMVNNLGLGWCDESTDCPDWNEFRALRKKVLDDLKKAA